MSIPNAIKGSLSAKVSLQLAALVLLLTACAAAVITVQQSRQIEETTLDKARTASTLGARYYGDALNHAIDAGLITVADAFDRSYVPIAGHDWGKNPRFHTRYDTVTDAAVVVFQDRFLADPDILFAIGMDENGYIPTHNSPFAQAFTGNPDVDVLNNTKSRATYEAAVAAGKNTEGVLVQDYFRTRTKEWTWDVSAPIFVKGRHWGAFRVGVSKSRVASHAHALVLLLTGLFAVFFVVTVGTMYAVVRRAMRPVVDLTAAAERISLGETLDVPIKPTTTDEIGRLTKQVDRLRASMKAAMSRLGHG